MRVGASTRRLQLTGRPSLHMVEGVALLTSASAAFSSRLGPVTGEPTGTGQVLRSRSSTTFGLTAPSACPASTPERLPGLGLAAALTTR